MVLVCAAVLNPAIHAQKPVKPARRIVQRVTPEYPASLKSARVFGLVRLNVTVAPGGDVTRMDVLGGNAIFSDCATKAVRKWKFAPSSAETMEEVEIRFNPESSKLR
jgi:TonB family protein